MPPIAILAVLGAGAYVAWRVARVVMDHVASTPEPTPPDTTKDTAAVARDLGSLEFDPKTGVYKPKT